MRLHCLTTTTLASVFLLAATVPIAKAESKPVTVKGYVLDSACAFTKNLDKPISAECARACAKGGSPLVILADNGSVYWPTSDAMPATSQNEKLLPFAAQKVVVSGKLYERGGSKALLIAYECSARQFTKF
jgi:hypothetical protein